jgi:hypothetical protein
MQADDKEKLQRSVEDSFSESDGLILGRGNEVGNRGLLERSVGEELGCAVYWNIPESSCAVSARCGRCGVGR